MGSLLIEVLAFILAGSTVFAEPIDLSAEGLTEPVSTVHFDEIVIADTALVSTQFAAFGVTFLPNMYYRTGDNPDWANVSGPNLRSGDPEVNPFSVHFENALTSAALIAIAQPPTPATITAKLNGVVVESFETTVSIDNPNNYFGFTDIVFDEIEIAYTASTRMRIDNVQLGEPSGGGIPFQITSLEIGPSNDEFTFIWPSNLNDVFSIERSEDLISFTELDDGIEGQEGSTSYSDPIPAGTKVRFYRVLKQ